MRVPASLPFLSQAWLPRPSRWIWPLVVATTSPAAFREPWARVPRRAGRERLRPQEGPGAAPPQGSRPLPFSGCPSRLDGESDTSGMSMRAQSRGLAPRRGSGRGRSARAGAGAQLGPRPQPVALPHCRRGLRGPVTLRRDPASFRSAGDRAGGGPRRPSASATLPAAPRGARRPGLHAPPLAGAPTGRQAPARRPAPPAPPAPPARAPPGRTGRRASGRGSRGTHPPAHPRGCPRGAAPTAGWARCRCPGTSTPPSPGGTASWRLRASPPAANFEVGAHGPAAAPGAAGAGGTRSGGGRPGGGSCGQASGARPSGGLEPPRPRPPVHAAPSRVGLPARAPQGGGGGAARASPRSGRRAPHPPRPLLGAPRAPRCSPPAGPLARSVPQPAARARTASRLARSLALCRAGCAPASPPPRRPPAPSALPAPPPAPALRGPPQARWGLLFPLPRLPSLPAEDPSPPAGVGPFFLPLGPPPNPSN